MSLTSSNIESRPEAHGGAYTDHGHSLPRKNMRRGTRSCIECRRRKMKCIFEPASSAKCNRCYARGSTCVVQTHEDVRVHLHAAGSEKTSDSLRKRVAKLEDLLNNILHRIPDRKVNASNITQLQQHIETKGPDAQAVSVPSSTKRSSSPHSSILFPESIVLPGGVREYTSALRLFDNAINPREDRGQVILKIQHDESQELVAALHQLLPCPADIEVILEAGKDWWQIWRKMFPEVPNCQSHSLKESVSCALRSTNPAEVAKIVLCIANSLYQMPSSFDWSRLNLKGSPQESIQHYINTVNRLVISNDETAATVDGIECMVLESKYHINMGRPRRAWLLTQRAIAFAQLLGLHRLANQQPEIPSDTYTHRASLWYHLFATDKFLSLMLGLPYSVKGRHNPVCTTRPNSEAILGPTEGEEYILRMIPIVTDIIDRNQSPNPLPYSVTLRIDQDIEEIYNAQTPDWWTTPRLPRATPEDHFNRLQAQFYHHQMRLFLHIPFMLESAVDKGYHYSHVAVLDSARHMVRLYKALRVEIEVVPFMCKIIDFQAFTAAMLLLLNLCGYAQQSRGVIIMQPDLDQDQQDSNLVDTTIGLLRDASKEAGGIVAEQACQALETLAGMRGGSDENVVDDGKRESRQISIPYFGTVTMAAGKRFAPPKKREDPRPEESNRQSSATSVGGADTNTVSFKPPAFPPSQNPPSPGFTRVGRIPDSSHSIPNVSPTQASGATSWFATGMRNNAYDPEMTGHQDAHVVFDSFMALPGQAQQFPSNIRPLDFTLAASGQGQFWDPNTQGFSWANGAGDLDQYWS